MTSKERAKLENKIKDLEKEVRGREDDLKNFRKQMAETNKRLEAIIANLNREIKLAMSIQKILIPTSFPHIKGIDFSYKFIPSTISGGDYFDIFEHEDKFKFGVLMASGSGHGMSSLLLSVLLKMSGRLEARKGDEPHKIIQFIYDELKTSISEKDSADIFYGVVNRRNFEMNYCLLGQIDFYMLKAENHELQILKSQGEAMKKGMTGPKKSLKVNLSSRDRLILCSRGICQTQNLEGDEFGKERLAKALLGAPDSGAHEIRNEVLMMMKKYSDGLQPQRDQTILVAEVKERIIKLASE